MTLDGVLVTDDLGRRGGEADTARERDVFSALAHALADDPADVCARVVSAARGLCDAASGGITVLEPAGARWLFVSGALAEYHGHRLPLDDCPTAFAVERGEPQLFADPARWYAALGTVTPRVVEHLVAPVFVGDAAAGALWVSAHDEDHHFTAAHASVLQSLAAFVAASLRTMHAERAARSRPRSPGPARSGGPPEGASRPPRSV